MMKPEFTIIQGGLAAPINDKEKRFVSAYVTNTRLMGVLAVYAHWEIDDGPCKSLHQFFYIDCEEYGLETYHSFRGEFGPEATMAEQALIGGLGADKIDITEKSLRWLLQHWKKFNDRHNLPFPNNYDEYAFIFDCEVILTHSERDLLISGICVDIDNDYQAVNYFLMRCFGQDYEAARYLTPSSGKGSLENDFPLDIYSRYVKATFCKNVIDFDRTYGDGSTSYLCESLVEMNGEHETVVSKVIVKDFKIIGFEYCSGFRLSAAEAAMMLKKTEYVNVYEVMADEKTLDDNIGEFTIGLNTVMTIHETGRMFMAFKKTNDHVKEQVFMLSNDVRGVYYLTNFGQLIVMANTERDIRALETRLLGNILGPYLVPTARYEFPDPVLFEFIHSGFDDFDEFIAFLED